MERILARAVQIVAAAALILVASGQETTPERVLEPADLNGLWVGAVSHEGESSPLALDLEPEDDGTALVKLTIPAIHLQRVPLGRLPLVLRGNEVRVGSFDLVYDPSSETLSGTVPESLAPVYALPFALRRRDSLDVPARPHPDTAEVEPLWTYESGSQLWPGASVANGLVLAGGEDGNLHALDPSSGRRRWTFHAGAAIRTRAVAAGDAVVFQADDGILYAVASASGSEVWRSRVATAPADRKPFSDPNSRYDRFGSDAMVAGERIFLGTHEGRVLCVSATDGATIWTFAAGDAVLAAPAVDGGRVYFGSFDGHIYAVDAASGRVSWKYDTGKPVVSTPAVAGGLVIVGSRSYDLLALDAGTGAVAWRRYIWFSWVESSPVVRDGTVFVGSSDAAALFAFDARSGRQVWKADVWGWAWGEPAVATGRVYIGTAGMRGYPAPHRGGVVAVNRTSGVLEWQYVVAPMDAATYGFTGSLAMADGRVFAAGLDGRVYAFAE